MYTMYNKGKKKLQIMFYRSNNDGLKVTTERKIQIITRRLSYIENGQKNLNKKAIINQIKSWCL